MFVIKLVTLNQIVDILMFGEWVFFNRSNNSDVSLNLVYNLAEKHRRFIADWKIFGMRDSCRSKDLFMSKYSRSCVLVS